METQFLELKSSSAVRRSNLNMWSQFPKKYCRYNVNWSKMPALKWSQGVNQVHWTDSTAWTWIFYGNLAWLVCLWMWKRNPLGNVLFQLLRWKSNLPKAKQDRGRIIPKNLIKRLNLIINALLVYFIFI